MKNGDPLMTEQNEQAWRKAIAAQVRRNCTPDSSAYAAGGDHLIGAVANWIENPPEWATFDAPTRSNQNDPAKIAHHVVITQDDITVDGESIPWMVSEEIQVRTMAQSEPGHPGLHGITVTIWAEDVDIVAPLRNSVEHITEVSTVSVSTKAKAAS